MDNTGDDSTAEGTPVFTIGFTGKSASDFFEWLRAAGIRRLVDVRLNNTSQQAGFTKRQDLPYFLAEICGVEYIHEPLLAPSQDLFDAYEKQGGTWQDYERGVLDLLAERRVEDRISRDIFSVPAVLLCAEPTADHCHQRLVLEYLRSTLGSVRPVHP